MKPFEVLGKQQKGSWNGSRGGWSGQHNTIVAILGQRPRSATYSVLSLFGVLPGGEVETVSISLKTNPACVSLLTVPILKTRN